MAQKCCFADDDDEIRVKHLQAGNIYKVYEGFTVVKTTAKNCRGLSQVNKVGGPFL
jgi:hypothetical protein